MSGPSGDGPPPGAADQGRDDRALVAAHVEGDPEAFPHIYGPLPVDAVVAVVPVST